MYVSPHLQHTVFKTDNRFCNIEYEHVVYQCTIDFVILTINRVSVFLCPPFSQLQIFFAILMTKHILYNIDKKLCFCLK